MKIQGREGLWAVLLVVGCVGSAKSSADTRDGNGDPPESNAKTELNEVECEQAISPDAPPFDQSVATGMLESAMERAWNCGLHNASTFDLTLKVSWGTAGCVSNVELLSETPSSTGECLIRQFKKASIQPFSGGAPYATVRMTNDRSWWSWKSDAE